MVSAKGQGRQCGARILQKNVLLTFCRCCGGRIHEGGEPQKDEVLFC